MAGNVDDLARRITTIHWDSSFDRETSRGYLMKEYLRRAAWWSKATSQARWIPFFDIAAAVDPRVRADPAVVDLVCAYVSRSRQGGRTEEVCVNALHFAALLDAKVPLPDAPDQPYEPLLLLLERGGGFYTEGGGLIDVDTLGIPIGKLEDNLRDEPWVQLDKAALDAVDEAGPPWRRKSDS
jgi:hypothetical protein